MTDNTETLLSFFKQAEVMPFSYRSLLHYMKKIHKVKGAFYEVWMQYCASVKVWQVFHFSKCAKCEQLQESKHRLLLRGVIQSLCSLRIRGREN